VGVDSTVPQHNSHHKTKYQRWNVLVLLMLLLMPL